MQLSTLCKQQQKRTALVARASPGAKYEVLQRRTHQRRTAGENQWVDPLPGITMQIADLITLLETILEPLGGRLGPGIHYEQPALEIERMLARKVRLDWVPWLGNSQSLTIVAHQPADITFTDVGLRELWGRLALIASVQAPLRKGPSIALTAVILANDLLQPDDTQVLERTLLPVARQRTIPLGIFWVDLKQGAFAYALRRGPAGLFPEAERIADEFSRKFRQFARQLDTDGVL